MNNTINIGIPSKGRLKKDVLKSLIFFFVQEIYFDTPTTEMYDLKVLFYVKTLQKIRGRKLFICFVAATQRRLGKGDFHTGRTPEGG